MRIVSISWSVIDERQLITVFRRRNRFENFSASLKQIFFFPPFFSRDRSNQISRQRAYEYFFQDIKTLPFFSQEFLYMQVFIYASDRRIDWDPQKKLSAVLSKVRYCNSISRILFLFYTERVFSMNKVSGRQSVYIYMYITISILNIFA